jgi:hypothetical protein
LLVAGNESLGFGGEIALTKTDSTGRFTLAQVPQGNYTVVVGRGLNELQIQAPDGIQPFLAPNNNWGANPFLDRISATPVIGEPGLSLFLFGMAGDGVAGRVSISVGTEAVEGLVVSTTVGATVSGRILYDGVDPAANDQGMRIGRPLIRLDPADGDISRVATSSTWDFTSEIGPAGPTFSIPNVMPGRYWFLGGDRSNRIVGATWNGRDLFATPLEVTGEGPVGDVVLRLSSKRNSVSGVIRASDSEVPSPGIVLIFPQNRNIWPEPGISAPLFRELEVSATGSFSVENLIPGDYFIVAFALESRKRGLDIGFLQSLAAQAKRITVDESARVTVELKLIGGRR